ncbi:MAG: carotenoid biosynthesis protein [Halodesulfurarchaeum sp.]
MSGLLFRVNLALALIAVGVCFAHAITRDRDSKRLEHLVLLVTTTVYGILLEQLVILRFDRYVYNVTDFLLTIGDVPVVIGLGWAAIIYSGIVIGDLIGLSTRVRPLFVGLYALHIDLAIDAIAIRIPFWSWTPPGIWFGVPLGNFLGWFLVATLFSAAWFGLRDRDLDRALGRAAIGPLSMLFALVGLIVLLEGWEAVATTMPRKIAILGAAVLLSVAFVWRDGLEHRPESGVLAAVPFIYHGAYLGYFLSLGMYRQTPFLLVVSIAMLGLSVLLHTGGIRGLGKRNGILQGAIGFRD